MRLGPGGTPDGAFGSKGVVYLGRREVPSQVDDLPDGSLLVGGVSKLRHVTADGTVVPSLEAAGENLAVFPDGSFAVARGPTENPAARSPV